MRALIAVVLAGLSVAACQSAPVTGRSQMMLVSESEELTLGSTAYLQVLSKEHESHDTQANELVERVGRRIAEAAESPPANMWHSPNYHWEFKTIDKKMLNAFCLPGGKVAVYTGLFAITETDAGLAAVLGHEVAHALARHGAERISDQRMLTVGLTAASLALAVAGGRRTSAYTPLAIAALGAGATVGISLPMSRTQESEADHIGLILMALAGYDPHEAVGLWERMRKAGAGKPKQAEWLSTHPADQTRIDNIKSWVPEAMKYYHPRD
jgi:metalloendopeptidase OMA1, mitochondrial